MALTKPTVYKGLDVPNTYAKIIEYKVIEVYIEGVKKYNADVYVSIFTDSTKENPLEGDNHRIEGLNMDELTIPTLYNKLKECCFTDWTDC